ncbi:histidine kinase dimerization/phospho-acceptor domain-containing protein [Ornithinibacillus sp. 179-J 7C1 HS]|uniref:sensor histidine kinase n=1 Tax=Ornithinibacillus sp. 179-J 7C1 HS TaxID=3142384 RepID=UPI0039A210B0
MGIKWKSSFIVLMICSLLFSIGITGIVLLADDGYNYAHKNYFYSPQFKYEKIDEISRYIGIFEINKLTLDEALENITVTDEEVEEHRYRYGDLSQQIASIESQYENLIQQALDEDNQKVADAYISERDAKIEDITKNFESYNHVRDKIVKEKEEEIKDYFNELEEHRDNYESYKDSINYYITDTNTGEVYTNLETTEQSEAVNLISNNSLFFIDNYTFNNWKLVLDNVDGSDDVYEMLTNDNRSFKGVFSVPNNLSGSNPFMMEYQSYKKEQTLFFSLVALSLISLLLSLIIIKRAKKSREEVRKLDRYYNKLPLDIRITLYGITVISTICMIPIIIYGTQLTMDDYFPSIELVLSILFFSVGLVLTGIQSNFLYHTVKNWKSFLSQWKKSLTYKGYLLTKKYSIKFIHLGKEAFLDQTTGTQIVLMFTAVFVLGLMSVMVLMHPIFVLFYIVILAGVGIPLAMAIMKKIGDFNGIVKNTTELANGNLSHQLKVEGGSVLAKLANNINVLKQGVKESQTEQAKSERLKTELITNVSHDLRTPLTSIITYTELLKEQGNVDEESAAYVEIIDRKSKRLKVLIDDLFEVSKMASGNIELKKEKVELVQLLQQALAEYDDMINDSSLQFRVTHDEPPINAVVDGQKLWRVFDNLIGNILKYSLENSRVYINLTANEGMAIISFKNVSKYELKDNTDELFERFKRGDTSRHTEGSGLGLAIAQSIVELHDGMLDIETDGDLFKVTINLRIEV